MLPQVYKSIELNRANFGHFTQNEYQVFLNLISKLAGADKSGKPLPPEQLQRHHILTAKEFSDLFKVSLHQSYTILKTAVDRLMEKGIRVQRLNERSYWKINVCSMAEYNIGEGYISVEFTDRIMPYLAQLRERFVLYDLKEITGFESKYTIRLYEMIQEFKDTGWMVKSISELREAFAVPEGKLKAYKDLKKRTFEHACQEINKHHNIELRFEEAKKGQKIVAIKFFFNRMKKQSLDFEETIIDNQPLIAKSIDDPMDTQPLLSSSTIHELRDTFHLTDKEILTLSQRRTEDKVNEAIETIKKKIAWKEDIPDLAAALKEQLTNGINGISSTLSLQSVVEKREIANENKKIIKDSRITSYLSNQQGIWRNICEELVEAIGEALFASWILKISFVEIQRDLLILKSITALARDRVKSDYGHKILDIAKQFNAAIKWIEII